MELDLSSQGDGHFLRKYLFNVKTYRSDGLILQVNHSYSDSCGKIKKNRFLHASFNDLGNCLALADHKGNIFAIDLEMEKYWQLPNVGPPTLISFPVLKKQELLISLDTGCIILYHIETGNIIGRLTGHLIPPTEASYTDDGYYCLTTCNKEAIVWDLLSYTQIHRLALKEEASLKKVVFMPVTNHILACFQDDTMNVWMFGTFECIKQIVPETWKTHHLRDVALTKNGRAMVIAGHTPNLVVFCLDSWSVKKVVEFPENISGVKQLEFVPQVFDGGANKILALLTTSLEIYFFDIETSTFLLGMHQIFGMTGKMTISGTGKYLASILTTGEVNIYMLEKVLSNADSMGDPIRDQILNADSGQVSRNLSSKSRTTQKSSQSLCSIKRQLREVLDLKKLQPILKQFGEYPESYRLLIWRTILQLPGNQESFISLTVKPCHPSYLNLDAKYPLVNKSLCNSLKKLLSNLSHWCPLFGEVNFLPEFVFPFVKLFHSDPLGCFEVIATVIVNWCQNWFEFYPFPPINMLSVLENVLGHHDPELLEFYMKNNITSSTTVCPLFHTAFSEVLSKTEWLKLWDHIFSNEPSFLFMAIVAYNVACRNAIQSLTGPEDIEKFFHTQNPIDMKMFISKTYHFLKETPEKIHSRQFFAPFRPLGSGGTYESFLAYPKLIVDPSVEKLQTIRREEEEILDEQMKALSIKQKLDRKLKKDDTSAGQERIYRELEDRIRQTVEEEEERILGQRQKLRNLRQELRLKELEVLEDTRNKALKNRQKRKELELERLVQDISKRRAREKLEVDMMEEEIRKYYSELLLKKCQLELELGVNSGESEIETNLEMQRERLKKDMYELQNEWTALQHSKRIEISNKMATIERLINDLEVENAKELAKREMGSLAENDGIEELKMKVKSLENQTEKLLQENLRRIQKKQEERKTKTGNLPRTSVATRSDTNAKTQMRKPEKLKTEVRTAPKRMTGAVGPRELPKRSANIGKRQGSHLPPTLRKTKEVQSRSVPATPIGPKPKSKLTYRRDAQEGEEVELPSKWQMGDTEFISSTDDEGGRPPEMTNMPKSVCQCACDEKTGCHLIRGKPLSSSKDYSFGSDSENEIFKSALRTREQIIEQAKRRQRPAMTLNCN